ncbi:MAG: hypothetical protein U5N56_08630 [Candidatus Marinimicrobia bacterium]|nr:hypothetical protein [Candidatus Neomarinimicrobiota bacterium]
MIDDYMEHISKFIDFRSIRKSERRPLIDSMGGAGQHLLEKILKTRGIACKTIFGKAKADFYGRNAEPMEQNLVPLAETLKDRDEYCCGFATDGDADRLGVMLENGEWLNAQETIFLLADHIIKGRGEVGELVKTASVTDKIRMLSSEEHPLTEVQVGFKYICEKMLTTRVAFGAEESGGFGYGMHIPERDGIFSALLFLEMLAKSGHTKLSDLVKEKRKEFGPVHYARIDHYYEQTDRRKILPLLYDKKLYKFSGFDILDTTAYKSARGDINGLKYRLSGDCRWVLLRASETEPLMRIYAEAQSQSEVNELLKNGIKHITE